VSEFFCTGRFDVEINLTVISLIHKIASPFKLSEFLYKIISKTLANRLKGILLAIIFANQSAFIPRRLITDNVVVAYERLYTLCTPRCGVKLVIWHLSWT
jgi:hypothetical protein